MFRPIVAIIRFYHSTHLRLFYTVRVAACLMRRSQHQNPCWSTVDTTSSFPKTGPTCFVFCFENMGSARKSRMERIKNEHIKEIMGVKGKPDIIDIIEKKILQWYCQVKRMPEERIPKLIMEWVPLERRKR